RVTSLEDHGATTPVRIYSMNESALSERSWLGLYPKTSRKVLEKCAVDRNPHLRAMLETVACGSAANSAGDASTLDNVTSCERLVVRFDKSLATCRSLICSICATSERRTFGLLKFKWIVCCAASYS